MLVLQPVLPQPRRDGPGAAAARRGVTARAVRGNRVESTRTTCTVHAPPSVAAPCRGVNCRVGPAAPPSLPPYRRGLGGPQGRSRAPGQGDRQGSPGRAGHRRRHRQLRRARRPARPPGHRRRPQPERPLRAGAPCRGGRCRRPRPRRPGRHPRPVRGGRPRAVTTRSCATASWSTSTTPPRAYATRSTRSARPARSACSAPASAVPSWPGRSRGTSPRPGRRCRTPPGAGVTATRCPAGSPPTS